MSHQITPEMTERLMTCAFVLGGIVGLAALVYLILPGIMRG